MWSHHSGLTKALCEIGNQRHFSQSHCWFLNFKQYRFTILIEHHVCFWTTTNFYCHNLVRWFQQYRSFKFGVRSNHIKTTNHKTAKKSSTESSSLFYGNVGGIEWCVYSGYGENLKPIVGIFSWMIYNFETRLTALILSFLSWSVQLFHFRVAVATDYFCVIKTSYISKNIL